jgi:hypothetical protein
MLSCAAIALPAQVLEISPNNKAHNYPEYTEAENFHKKKQVLLIFGVRSHRRLYRSPIPSWKKLTESIQNGRCLRDLYRTPKFI